MLIRAKFIILSNRWAKVGFIAFAFVIIQVSVYPQVAFEHLSNKGIYSFIDELASAHTIDVTTAVKPYSREQIARWLFEASSYQNKLSRSQLSLLSIYLREFAIELNSLKTGNATLYKKNDRLSVHLLPPEVVWRDSLFRSIIRPVYGAKIFKFREETFIHTYGGAEAVAYVGGNWSFYASLRDNYQQGYVQALPTHFSQEPGGTYKGFIGVGQGGEFSEMRGGIVWSWDWGSFGLVKDHIAWGDNYNGSNIYSGRTPSFPLLKLHLKPVNWLEFNYFHGWLISEVRDSVRSYITQGGYNRTRFREKYIASNLYTFKPLKRLHLSVGNAIIYSDIDFQPGYLIPFSFFKSIDHTINRGIENQNSMMFFNISSRQVKYLHVFLSIFIDEFSVRRVFNDKLNNFNSYKGGLSLQGWPIRNLGVYTEFTRTLPNTFEHYIETTTFESNRYNLGHYLRGNSKDFFVSLRYRPIGKVNLSMEYLYAMHGNDYPYDYNLEIPVDQFPVLEEKSWDQKSITFKIEYLPITNTRIFAEYSFNNIVGYALDDKPPQYYLDKFSPLYLHGNTNGIVAGFGIGF